MKNSSVCLALFVAFIFSSCAALKDVQVEKRRYGKGYYVHVRKDRATEPNRVETEAVNAGVPVENVGAVAPVEQKIPQQATAVPAKTKTSFAKDAPSKKSVGDEPAFAPSKGSASIVPSKAMRVFTGGPADDEAEVVLILLVILAILLPPLAVLLKEGLTYRFLLDLVFWLLGYSFIVFIPGGGFIYLGIFGLIAIIYALLIVLDVI